MDEKEKSLTESLNASEASDKRIRWRGHNTFAAAIITVGALVFGYAGATASSTVARDQGNALLAAQLVTVADVSYLVTEEGELYSQGLNNLGQLGLGNFTNSSGWELVTFPVEGDQPKISKISSYGEHAIALDSSGGLWTWGDSESAALGAPHRTPFSTPSRLNVSYTMDTIEAGDDFALALDSRGKLHSWGQNDFGQLGTGDQEPRTGPTLIMGDRTFKSIGAGANFSLAVEDSGALWAWGSNEEGQFGDGSKESSLTPKMVSEGPWEKVFPSRFVSTVAAVSAEGILHTWGPGANALIGNGRDWRGEQAAENQRVENEKNRIRAEDDRVRGELFEAYRLEAYAELLSEWEEQKAAWDEALAAWEEENPEPQQSDFLRVPTQPTPTATPTPNPTPSPTPTPTPTLDIAAYERALGQWNDARTRWLETNPEPPRPDNVPQETLDEIEARVAEEFTYTDTSGIVPAVIEEPEISGESLTPTAIATGVRFVSASVGSENAFAIDTDGKLWSWGNDENGQSGLGFNETTHTHAPVKVNETNLSEVYAGPQWAVAVGESGIYTWGLNDEANRLNSAAEELLAPTGISGEAFSRVSGSIATGIASREDGTTVSWGANSNGIAGRGSEESALSLGPVEGSYRAITFAANGVISLSQGVGSIFFWGNNEAGISSGQGAGETFLSPTRQVVSGFTDVAAGRLSTHVLDSNGFVWTWGLSWLGNVAPPATALEAPVRVPLDTRISKLAAAQTNVLLVTEANELLSWGSDRPQQQISALSLPNNEALTSPVAQVVAGKTTFLIRGEEGELWSFGARNHLGEVYSVETPGPVSSVAAGGDSYAMVVDGKAYGWGANENQQLVPGGDSMIALPTELPAPLSGRWKTIAVSSTHTLASTDDGVLYGWGSSPYLRGFGSPVEAPVHVKVENER